MMVFVKAQEIGGIRVSFLLGTFLSTAWMQEVGQCRSNCRGQAKKSTSVVDPRTDLKNIRRDSDNK